MKPLPFEERLKRQVTVSATGCWLWRSITSRTGYGRVTVEKRSRIAHRWVWEVMRGPVPEGMQLDHLCRVRNCVNPDHLEVVTPQVNTIRSYVARGIGDVCARGHLRAEHGALATGNRIYCKQCLRMTTEARRGQPIRPAQSTCGSCGREMATQNLSRHQASCQKPGHVFRPNGGRVA